MADPFEGSTVAGRYRVRHILGVGGSASVYEAEDLTFGRTVALKIPHGNAGSKTVAAKRLVREARASGAVGHPNVCEISEIGVLPGGTPFVVMERLVGETLRDRITNAGRLPFGDIVDIMMQVLSGLGAAHEHGIIHRDIKPENIFLSRRAGCPALVKILDFGLVATDQPSREDLTAAGRVVGTPHYLAPEQIRGTREFDPAVDLYACGVVLYEATTGRRPFTSANIAELFREILAASPPDVTDLRRDTPPLLAAVITRAMSVAATDRFGSASAFQGALAKVHAERPTPASLAPFKAGPPLRLPDARSATGPAVQAEGTRVEGRVVEPSTFNMANVGNLEETRIEGRIDDKSIDIEFSNAEDWDHQTEWDQPTVKNPIPDHKSRKK
jgi:eukaryotic-like serine/threonine-protein kinase